MGEPEDLDQLAEDWIALWQSEIAGLVADPAFTEQWAAFASLGAAWLRAAARFTPVYPSTASAPDDSAAAPPRTAPPVAPSGAGGDAGHGGSRDDARDAMAERLATLERRLADLEAGAGRNGTNKRRPRGGRARA